MQIFKNTVAMALVAGTLAATVLLPQAAEARHRIHHGFYYVHGVYHSGTRHHGVRHHHDRHRHYGRFYGHGGVNSPGYSDRIISGKTGLHRSDFGVMVPDTGEPNFIGSGRQRGSGLGANGVPGTGD